MLIDILKNVIQNIYISVIEEPRILPSTYRQVEVIETGSGMLTANIIWVYKSTGT